MVPCLGSEGKCPLLPLSQGRRAELTQRGLTRMGRGEPSSDSTWENATHASPWDGAWTPRPYAGFWLRGIGALHDFRARTGGLPCADHLVLLRHQSVLVVPPSLHEGKRHCEESWGEPRRGGPETWCWNWPQPTAGLFCRLGPSRHRGAPWPLVSTQASCSLAFPFPASLSLLAHHPPWPPCALWKQLCLGLSEQPLHIPFTAHAVVCSCPPLMALPFVSGFCHLAGGCPCEVGVLSGEKCPRPQSGQHSRRGCCQSTG